jgi:thioesterase domain-containing protein
MAAYYLDRVRSIQPSGPYLFGGLCAGGTIAFEMALQLRRAGIPVGLVALLDSADARAKLKPYLNLRRRWCRFVASFRRHQPTQGKDVPAPPSTAPEPALHRPGTLGRVLAKGRVALSKLSNVLRYELGLLSRRFAEGRKVRKLRAALAHGRVPSGVAAPSVRVVYEHSERRYTPRGCLDAATLLVRAGADGLDYASDEPLLQRLRDPHFGWGGRLTGGSSALKVIDAPGGHGGMLQEPYVQLVAAHLQEAIDRVVKECSVAEVCHAASHSLAESHLRA